MEIKLNNVSYTYKKANYDNVEVLNNINIHFKKETINGIIGKGKTTLLQMLNGTFTPTNGTITIDNINIKKIDLKELRFKIGVVQENPKDYFIGETVFEELTLGLILNNYRVNEAFKRASDALKMVGLNNSYLFLKPNNLSKSEIKKVAIAETLMYNPKVIILDEPATYLDNKSKIELISLLRLLKKRYHKTIIIASNDTDFLHKIVDYVFVLHNKELVLEGDKYKVFTSDLKKYGIIPPKIIQFEKLVLKEKKVRLGYRDEINDLIKDIYRNVR